MMTPKKPGYYWFKWKADDLLWSPALLEEGINGGMWIDFLGHVEGIHSTLLESKYPNVVWGPEILQPKVNG